MKIKSIEADDSATDQRVAQLEADLVAAHARIAALEQKLPADPVRPQPPEPIPDRDRGVVVTYPQPRIEWPTSDEMRKLYELVCAKWPAVREPTAAGLARFVDAFSYMVSAVSHADRRSPYGSASWIDRAGEWLRAHGRSADVSWPAICAAANTLGFATSPLVGSPVSWDLWAATGEWRLPGSDHWKGLLAGQPWRQPNAPVVGKLEPLPSPVQITGGNEVVGPRSVTW